MVSCSDVHAPFCLGRVCSACSCQRASRLLSNKQGEPQEAADSEERVRPRNTLAPFVRVRCAATRTILAHLERRAVHMEPRTRPSQTCLVSLLGFVSFSTYFPIRNKLQLVTLWKGPRTLSIGCVWMASWVDSPQVCGDGAGAALLQGARCGQASVTWWV